MNTNQQGRSVLVTGAGGGIGRTIAVHLAARGWDVFAGVPDAGCALAGRSQRITPIQLDITVEADLANLDEVLSERLDAVMSNAGISVGGPMDAAAAGAAR
jgi:NAD(P)-dependent dehydrogenase (short-subunit alcohol dehydrogenase family)